MCVQSTSDAQQCGAVLRTRYIKRSCGFVWVGQIGPKLTSVVMTRQEALGLIVTSPVNNPTSYATPKLQQTCKPTVLLHLRQAQALA